MNILIHQRLLQYYLLNKSQSINLLHLKNYVSFTLASFEGKIETENIFPFPKVLIKHEEETLKRTIGYTHRIFRDVNNSASIDALDRRMSANMDALKRLGAFGLQVPRDYGGMGLNNTQYANVLETVGSFDLGSAIILGSHQGTGLKGILLYGNEKQKRKYLPMVSSGKKLTVLCLSDPPRMPNEDSVELRAVMSTDGSHYILNGCKVFINNMETVDIFTVLAKTVVHNEQGVVEELDTAFIVEKQFPGLVQSPSCSYNNTAHPHTTTLSFTDCKVSVDNILGVVGQGHNIAMQILNSGRCGVVATLAGAMKTCIEMATQFSLQHSQHGDKFCDYEIIQEKLSQMALKHYITESMAYLIARNTDSGIEYFQVEAAISKIYASEAALFCCNEAIQIMGELAFQPEMGMDTMLKYLRQMHICDGINEEWKLFIVVQGLQHILRIMADEGRIVTEIKRMLRKVGVDSVGDFGPLNKVVHAPLILSAKKLAFCIAQFSGHVHSLLLQHKQDILVRQFILTRLANCCIEIFAMIVALSRANMSFEHDTDPASVSHQTDLATLACSQGSESVNEILSLMEHSGQDFVQMKLISDRLCRFGKVIQRSPSGF